MMPMMTSAFIWLFWTLFLKTPRAIVGEMAVIWEENFDGDSLNDTVWTLNTGNGCDLGEEMCGWGNHEQQTYTLDNHLVADGVLTITAKREDVEVDDRWYTSSRLRSNSPVAFLTGRIEARISLPAGLGLWAAFWMLPANDSRGDWAASGEIDIMESVNDMNTVLATIHYGGEYPENLYAGCKQSSGLDFSGDYHIYAIEWQKDEMNWYVDGQLYCHRTKWTSTLDSLGSYTAPFDAEFELLINLAVGGTLPGRFVNDTAFPASMLVDYIRVYNITLEDTEAEPYLGVPACLPGFIEAEAYDIGGLGLGYGDSQPEGSYGTFRTDGTGLVATNGERTYVENLTEGDWTAYSVMTDGIYYDISLEVRTTEAASLHLLIGEDANCSDPLPTSRTGDVAVEPSGSNGEWITTFIYEIFMPAGTHSLKLCVTGGVGMDVDRITFNLRDTNIESVNLSWDECGVFGEGRPYMFNEPWAIPGYMEAEYYDQGGPGVGFHVTGFSSNSERSTLRLPDGVDVIEADSNPVHGHYVGNWETGEWLAFTSRAEQGGWWDVAASIASGAENTSIEFRILVNASNCSLPETDGFNGLGAEGVDLLDGPLIYTDTGSWEAFELVMKPDVWVPQGDHRVMFCADSGSFNLNYLWFFTPNPTPVPTPSPTPAPTAAPQAPSKKKPDTDWIYAAVFVPLGVLALSRMCWIVYRKERSRRQKPTTLNELDFASTSRDNEVKPSDSYSTPPMAASSSDGTVFKETPMSAIALRTRTMVTAAAASGGHLKGNGNGHGNGMGNVDEEYKQQQKDYVRILPHRFAFGAFSKGFRGHHSKQQHPAFHSSGGGIPVHREPPSAPEVESGIRPALHNERRYFATVSGSLQPMVSPVESSLGVGAFEVTTGVPAKTPRAYADLDVQEAGSLWDRSSLKSPIRRNAASGMTLEIQAKPKRDQFEDALLRALDTRLESSRAQHATNISSPKPRLLRASSFSEGTSTSNQTPMLAAGKVWTCVCEFENTVGQASCLGCGRIAPSRRGSEGGLVTSTPMRTRLPPHRMRSFIPPSD